MTTINDAYIKALLADSAYVSDLLPGMTGTNFAGQIAGRMTPDIAKYVGDNFTVVSQVGGLASSFDATVWRGNAGTPYAGQIYVSMRGTQEGPDFAADVDLAGSGLAHRQLADLVNSWLRATTPTLTDADTPRYATQITVAPNGDFGDDLYIIDADDVPLPGSTVEARADGSVVLHTTGEAVIAEGGDNTVQVKTVFSVGGMRSLSIGHAANDRNARAAG